MLVRKLIKLSPFVGLTLLNLAALSANAAEGGISGGGGDARTEMRMDAIRADILSWIAQGGAAGLNLPSRLDLETYQQSMTQVLVPHAVVIGSVTSAEASALPVGSELRVGIGANPKTCKGFVSASEGRPHILCNVDRFANTNPAEQYRLIHHEYAGLARVELNVGASSDYEVSQQLTEFLVPETVLRLAVRRPIVSDQLIDSIFGDYELVSQVMDHGGHGCSSTLRLREVVVEAPQASHIRLDLDYWNHPIYTEVGRTIWEAQGYLADEDGDLHHEISQGRVTRRYEMTRLQNTLTLNIAEEFIENSGRRGFSRAFRRTRSNGGYVFGFILDRRTGLLNFNKHQYGSEDSRDSAQVCIMRRVGH